MQYQGV